MRCSSIFQPLRLLRGSGTRTFDNAASITLVQLSTILDYATRGLPADFLEPPGAQLNDLYLIVHSVQGLKSGAYFFRREPNTLELLKEGEFRAEAHHLGLEQDLPADACVDIFFLADLKPILERYELCDRGCRGSRYARSVDPLEYRSALDRKRVRALSE